MIDYGLRLEKFACNFFRALSLLLSLSLLLFLSLLLSLSFIISVSLSLTVLPEMHYLVESAELRGPVPEQDGVLGPQVELRLVQRHELSDL